MLFLLCKLPLTLIPRHSGSVGLEVLAVAKGGFKFVIHARTARIATRHKEEQEGEQEDQEQED